MASAEEIAKSLESITGGNDEEATVKDYLDTGYPELNHALTGKWDGGFPGGRMIEVSGPPSAGKTAITTRVMAAAQRRGGVAGFMDHERSFALTLAPKLGLDTTPGRFIYKKPESFEKSVAMSVAAWRAIRERKLIPADAPIAWAFDSLAAMIPNSLLYDAKGNPRSPDDRNMRDKMELSMCASTYFPLLAQAAEEHDVCCVILNQLRTKPGVTYGDPTYTPGGDAKDFYYSQRIRLNAARLAKGSGASAEVLGQQVTAKITKNKVYRAHLTATWKFIYQPDGSGRFDVERSLIDFLLKQKLLDVSGNYIVWEGAKLYPEALARKIEKEGKLEELIKLLPPEYEPPIVASTEEGAEAA